jgi:hypothetical protein
MRDRIHKLKKEKAEVTKRLHKTELEFEQFRSGNGEGLDEDSI